LPTTRLTATVLGELLASGALIVTVPLYVPAASPVIFTLTVPELGVSPEMGLTFNHDWFDDAVQLMEVASLVAISNV
jgi:hypothetical protein